jgi:hypothetical protein
MKSALFWDITQRALAIPYRRLETTCQSRGRYVVPKRRRGITTLRCVISQKSADLIHTATAVWNHEVNFVLKSTARVSNEGSFPRRNSRLPWTGFTHQMYSAIHTLHPTLSPLSSVHILVTNFPPLWPTSSLPATCRSVCPTLHDWRIINTLKIGVYRNYVWYLHVRHRKRRASTL